MACAQTLVLAAADSVPTAYVDNGKQTGILVDVVTEAFKRTGDSVEIAIMPWARCLTDVKAGKIDGIFSVYRTPARQECGGEASRAVSRQVKSGFWIDLE
jgi:polar amino acid transport system substrate-binding protein